MKKERIRKWKLSNIGEFLRNSLMAILKGEFLLRLNVGRYLIHIIYTFVLFTLVIWVSFMIDNTMVKVENNKKTLEDLKAANLQKTYEYVSLTRRSTVGRTLEMMGSEVKEATRPAKVLE